MHNIPIQYRFTALSSFNKRSLKKISRHPVFGGLPGRQRDVLVAQRRASLAYFRPGLPRRCQMRAAGAKHGKFITILGRVLGLFIAPRERAAVATTEVTSRAWKSRPDSYHRTTRTYVFAHTFLTNIVTRIPTHHHHRRLHNAPVQYHFIIVRSGAAHAFAVWATYLSAAPRLS